MVKPIQYTHKYTQIYLHHTTNDFQILHLPQVPSSLAVTGLEGPLSSSVLKRRSRMNEWMNTNNLQVKNYYYTYYN